MTPALTTKTTTPTITTIAGTMYAIWPTSFFWLSAAHPRMQRIIQQGIEV
jgi:hypothetical protein